MSDKRKPLVADFKCKDVWREANLIEQCRIHRKTNHWLISSAQKMLKGGKSD